MYRQKLNFIFHSSVLLFLSYTYMPDLSTQLTFLQLHYQVPKKVWVVHNVGMKAPRFIALITAWVTVRWQGNSFHKTGARKFKTCSVKRSKRRAIMQTVHLSFFPSKLCSHCDEELLRNQKPVRLKTARADETSTELSCSDDVCIYHIKRLRERGAVLFMRTSASSVKIPTKYQCIPKIQQLNWIIPYHLVLHFDQSTHWFTKAL